MQVVVVKRQRNDHVGRTGESGAGTHKNLCRAGRHEAVDQVLRASAVDVRRGDRLNLAAIAAWVVDVDVEPDLV